MKRCPSEMENLRRDRLSAGMKNSNSGLFDEQTSLSFRGFYSFAGLLELTVICLILMLGTFSAAAQTVPVFPTPVPTPYSAAPVNPYTNQPSYTAPGNYLKNSAAFRQEIARMEINVVRSGREILPITEVPRVEKDDVIKVRLLDEAVNGIKPDQSYWDWTFLVAFANPSRSVDKEKSVSQEIRFRKTGWYREYSFTVPFDSQPVFFLYPKPKYRNKILKLINSKYEDLQKLGEKTVEIAGAYAQIGSFLNELQGVLARTQASVYGNFINYSAAGQTVVSGSYLPGGYYAQPAATVVNYNALLEQTIERLAQSFNIQLPNCWQTLNGNITYGNYGIYARPNNYGYGIGQDVIGRAQCVAKNVRIEDFDLSISRMLKEGGIFALTQLRDRYPQLAYWINIAAAAVDFIVKVFQKNPLKIVPTIVSTSLNQSFTSPNPVQPGNRIRIALFAESQPSEQGSVTAYPIVMQKWQSDEDPEIINLPPPLLLEPCLHAGQNILKNTDLSGDPVFDSFTKSLSLILTAQNGVRKEFALRNNAGLGGWEFDVRSEDLNQLSKTDTAANAELIGKRGFNEIKSPKFGLPIDVPATWQLEPESRKNFIAGGKRTLTLSNSSSACRCLQTIAFKSSSAAPVVLNVGAAENSLRFSADGKEVSFEIDASALPPGQAQLEIKTYGGAPVSLPVNLYPALPEIKTVEIARGDNTAIIVGERLEQLKFIKINGKKAIPQAVATANGDSGQNLNRHTFVFEDPGVRQTDKTVMLDLGLQDERVFHYQKTFTASLARPAFVADRLGEIEAVVADKEADSRRSLDFERQPVVSVKTGRLVVSVKNKLTDYNFKQENLSVEKRIENSRSVVKGLPEANYEVLDADTLRVSFTFNDEWQKAAGGRRLQFRIKDKERGDSDWYTIRQTFIRTPENLSVDCQSGTDARCVLTGENLSYISQISVDGGVTWDPQNSDLPVTLSGEGGKELVSLSSRVGKNMLRVRLRDFTSPGGFQIVR